MNNVIKVQYENNSIKLIFKKYKNNTLYKTISTTNPEIIYNFFEDINSAIKDINYDINNMTIRLKDNTTIEIPNDIDIKKIYTFNPLTRSIVNYKKKKKKKTKSRRTNLRISLFAMVFFMANNNSIKLNHAEDVRIVFENEENCDIDNNNIQVDDSMITLGYNIFTDDAVSYLKSFMERELFTNNYSDYIPSFGENTYDEKYNNIVDEYDDIVEKYSLISGIDKEIIICLLAQERGSHSSVIDDGGAIGIGQIQVNQHLNSTVSLYNTLTDEKEEFVITMDMLRNVEGNIKTSVALLQSALIKFDGNIFLALQAYNYGEGAINTIIKRSGLTLEEINENYRDLSWINEVYRYSDKKGGYGDKNYIDNVLSRYPSDEITVIYNDDNTTVNMNKNVKKRTLN